ncbi:MAG: LEA type 2 family protein [Burkholderiales bacterium]
MTRRIALSLILAATLAACAALGPRLASPEVVGANVRVIRVALPEVTLAIDLELSNPNPVEVVVQGFDARIALEGERVATAALASPVTMPANGTAAVSLSARADAAATLAGVGRALGSGRAMRYEIAGDVTLGDGSRFPFVRRGETAGAKP